VSVTMATHHGLPTASSPRPPDLPLDYRRASASGDRAACLTCSSDSACRDHP
jgi:hypothetical protein